MSYEPNFSDPRIQRRLRKVLGWCRFNLSPTKPNAWHQKALDNAFGMGQNDFSSWLRDRLLIVDRDSYAYRGKDGKLVIKGNYKNFFDRVGDLDENLHSGTCKTYLRNQAGYEYLLTRVKDQERGTHTPVHGGISAIQVAGQCFGDRLGIEWADGKYGEQLRSGQFTYGYPIGGRITHGLQNMCREHKPTLWRSFGYVWDYDIVACAPTLLLQHARRTGFKRRTPAYDAYLQDRKQLRSYLVQLIGVDYETAKRVVNGLFNGARLSTREKDKLMLLLKDGRLIRLLKADAQVKALKRDISLVWAHLRQIEYPDQPKTEVKRKAAHTPVHRGISATQVAVYTRTKTLSGSQKWKLYYRLERQVLEAVRPELEAKGPTFLEHDGWRTVYDWDTGLLSQLIRERTNFEVTIEKERL